MKNEKGMDPALLVTRAIAGIEAGKLENSPWREQLTTTYEPDRAAIHAQADGELTKARRGVRSACNNCTGFGQSERGKSYLLLCTCFGWATRALVIS